MLNVQGNLLKEMGNMKNMRELIMFGNYFAGTIPRELSKMKKLGTLTLILFATILFCGRVVWCVSANEYPPNDALD